MARIDAIRRKRQTYQATGVGATTSLLAAAGDGPGWVDRLAALSEPVRAFRDDLVTALGGADAVSPQQLAIANLAARSWLLVETCDAFILSLPSPVDRKRKRLYHVVEQRARLAQQLERQLGMLGLERRAREISYQDILRERAEAQARQTAIQPETKAPGAPGGQSQEESTTE